jgi:hypothetical protein
VPTLLPWCLARLRMVSPRRHGMHGGLAWNMAASGDEPSVCLPISVVIFVGQEFTMTLRKGRRSFRALRASVVTHMPQRLHHGGTEDTEASSGTRAGWLCRVPS